MENDIKKLFLKDIGERIRKTREDLGFTREMLSSKIDLSPDMIKKLENGSSDTKVTSLVEISKVLNTTPDFILLGEDNYIKNDSLYIPKSSLLNNESISYLKKAIDLIIEMQLHSFYK